MNTKEDINKVIKDLQAISSRLPNQCMDFYQILINMVGLSVFAQEKFNKCGYSGIEEDYLKEYCTINLSGPRQCGHTNAMVQLVKEEWDRLLQKTLIIVSTRMEIDRVKGLFYGVVPPMVNIISQNTKLPTEKLYDTVIIDTNTWLYNRLDPYQHVKFNQNSYNFIIKLE